MGIGNVVICRPAGGLNYSDVITIIPPWRQKNRKARSTALQPIRLITKRVVAGRHCIITYFSVNKRSSSGAKRVVVGRHCIITYFSVNNCL